jgi:hypothetical protein
MAPPTTTRPPRIGPHIPIPSVVASRKLVAGVDDPTAAGSTDNIVPGMLSLPITV